jgi:hypothetical protein
MTAARIARLNKLFDSVTRGKQDLSPQSCSHFLEAACAQSDPLMCFDKLTSNAKALDALQTAMFADSSLSFLNGMGARVFAFLQTPALAGVGGGALLNKVLLKLTSPRFLFNAYKNALLDDKLDMAGQKAFSWFLRQLVTLPSDTDAAPYREIAPEVLPALISSPFHDVKACGQAIERALATTSLSSAHIGSVHGPGGRHDNDFEDFKQIAILPTADEIQSTKPPFLLSALAVEDAPSDKRPSVHIDNQFRLLREDMIYEIREELQKVVAKTKGKGMRGFQIEGLQVVGIYGGSGQRTTRWGLQLECQKDLWFFERDKPKDRKRYLVDDKRIIKHQSLACLIVDDEVTALTTIHRDEELLSRAKPIIVLQFDGETATTDALIRLKSAQKTKLIQVDTAVFAYEPVLRSLQSMPIPVLSPEIFLWDDDPLKPPPVTPESIIRALERDPKRDLAPLLGLTKSTILDSAQCTSLLAALRQRVSLIQGPPGKFSFTFSYTLNDAVNRNRQVVYWCACREDSLRYFGSNCPCVLLHESCSRPVSRGPP